MRSHDKRSYSTAGGAALALALSGLLLAGCSSDPEASTVAPSTSAPSPSASRSPTASASRTPSPTSAAPAETAAPAPVPPAPVQPAPVAPAPAPLTAEDAEKIIADYHQNNADLGYTVFDNADGTFDVKVTSLSIAAQGGTGTAGLYVVEQRGSFALK